MLSLCVWDPAPLLKITQEVSKRVNSLSFWYVFSGTDLVTAYTGEKSP